MGGGLARPFVYLPTFHRELDILHRLNVLDGITFHGDDVSQDASTHVLYALLVS